MSMLNASATTSPTAMTITSPRIMKFLKPLIVTPLSVPRLPWLPALSPISRGQTTSMRLWDQCYRDLLHIDRLPVLRRALEHLDRAGLGPCDGVRDRDRVAAAAAGAAARRAERPGDLVAGRVQDAHADHRFEDVGRAGHDHRARHLLADGRVLHGDRWQVAVVHRGGLRTLHGDSAEHGDTLAVHLELDAGDGRELRQRVHQLGDPERHRRRTGS